MSLDRTRPPAPFVPQASVAAAPSAVRNLTLAAMMAALLAVLSWVSVPLPFSPVPVTLQTLGVLLAGALLGPRWGAVSVLVWAALGLVGAPVYHGFLSGPAVAFGPTGGFVWSFAPAAALAGLAAIASRRMQGGRAAAAVLVVGFLVAECVFYLVGIPWLAVTTGMSLPQAVAVGMLPYLPGDLLKIVAAVLLVRGVERALASPGTLPVRP